MKFKRNQSAKNSFIQNKQYRQCTIEEATKASEN